MQRNALCCRCLLSSCRPLRVWANLDNRGCKRQRVSAGPLVGAPKATDELHVPVLLTEVMELFQPVCLQVFVDGTLGAGGHSAALCDAHPEMKVLLGTDLDEDALAVARQRVEGAAEGRAVEVQLQLGNFTTIPLLLQRVLGGSEGVVDGLLLDLGMSSMQVESGERGFSFLREGPLDMRMNRHAATSAADLVNGASEAQLGEVIREYGEERFWRQIAGRIVKAREVEPITTTSQLVEVIGRLPGSRGGPPLSKKGGVSSTIHPATRTFQALRIAVNAELRNLESVLPAALAALKPGGRCAVMSFHSLEDRLVKHAFQQAAGERGADGGPPPSDMYGNRPPPAFKLITRKPVVAGDAEVATNPRARSAKLRCVEKLCLTK